jgi:hypothetical protein
MWQLAAGDRVVARRCGFGEVEVDSAFENGTGEPGRAGADIAGLSVVHTWTYKLDKAA